MQEQLNNLRKFVEAHAAVLRSRAGPTLLKTLSTRSGDEHKEEKKWHTFIRKAEKNFDSVHRAHFAATEAMICVRAAEPRPDDSEAHSITRPDDSEAHSITRPGKNPLGDVL